MAKLELEPFGERIIVRQITVDQIGLIILPEQAKRKSIEGEIIAVGPDAEWVKVGDHVIFGRHAGMEIPSELEGYRGCVLMNYEDLLAKVPSQPRPGAITEVDSMNPDIAIARMEAAHA